MRQRPGRIAAIVALVAAAVVVVSLAVLIVRNVPALLAALGALVIAGAAGWIAVTRRGAVRVLAAAVAAAALIGGAIALVVLDAVDELVVLVLAVSAFAAATRRALHGPATQKAAAAQPGSRAARPRRAILLMNPKSGGGKVERFDLVREARRRQIEPVLLQPGDDLRTLAHEAARSAEVIGMAGGDGSQALVAQVAMEHDLPYVCIPAGTRNHLALDLGLDRDDVVGALDAFVDGGERRIDLAFVNDRIFVNNVSLGIYAEIVQSDAYRDAKRATVETMLPELLGPDATPSTSASAGPTVASTRRRSSSWSRTTATCSTGSEASDRARGSTLANSGSSLSRSKRRAGGEARVAERTQTALAFRWLARVVGHGVRSRLERAGRDRHRRGGGRARPAAAIHDRPACAHGPAAARRPGSLTCRASARLHRLTLRDLWQLAAGRDAQ